MAIQIGKYKRPGIFIEEFDKSIIPTPQSVDQLTNLVMGVSKKGPVNTPVKVSTLGEFEAIFGEIDRNLERKGSFFHRTVSKMLESSPVYAMNLLLTNDNLDRVEYQTLSTSSDILNDPKRLGPFRRFHDTTGFWKKDTESFLNLVRANSSGHTQRPLNITNLSDKPVSVFIYKSRVTNYDITAESWYGVGKVPAFINRNDLISDYMVDVVIVDGNWSDYRTLAQDKEWSKYFFFDNKLGSGIRKNLVLDFIRNRNVKLLGYYEGLSLIPYFRDRLNNNLFIETNLNRDTNKTGIFCSYNLDIFETDGLNIVVDLVGHTIAAKNENTIDFLSYKANIAEENIFSVKPLDLPGNVTANLGGMTWSNTSIVVSGTLSTNLISNRSSLADTQFKYKDHLSSQAHFYGGIANDGYKTSASNYNYNSTNTTGPTFSGVQASNYYMNRTSWFAESTYWGIRLDSAVYDSDSIGLNSSNEYYSNAASLSIKYLVHPSSYFVINDQYRDIKVENLVLNTDGFREVTFTINASTLGDFSATQSVTAVAYYEFNTSQIKIKVGVRNAASNGITGITANDVVLNTFQFKYRMVDGVNKFVPFNRWNISYDINNNRLEGRYTPVYSGLYYGVGNNSSNGVWNILQPDNVTFTNLFQNHWLNTSVTTQSRGENYAKIEPIHIDTSFVPLNGNLYPNPLIHDNSDFIGSFYKNTAPSDKYLFDDPNALIGASGSISYTGGKYNTTGGRGFAYDARMFTYTNIDRWDYADLVPVFATNSSNGNVQVGRCTFWYDSATSQLFALKDPDNTDNSSSNNGTNWNPSINQLKRGDSVVVYKLNSGNPFVRGNKIIVGDSEKLTFSSTDTASTPIALIVDRVVGNRIYFFNSFKEGALFTNLEYPGPLTESDFISTDFLSGGDFMIGTMSKTLSKSDLNILQFVTVNGNIQLKKYTNDPIQLPNLEVKIGSATGTIAFTASVTIIGASGSTVSIGGSDFSISINLPRFHPIGLTAGTTFVIGSQSFNQTANNKFLGTASSDLRFKINGLTSSATAPAINRYTLEELNHSLFDYKVTYDGAGKLRYTFLNTDNTPNPNNPRIYRRHKMFNKLVALLNSPDIAKRVMVLNPDSQNAKVSMAGMSVSNIVTSITQNKSFVLNTNLPNSEIVKSRWEKVLQGFLCIYTVDDEVILGPNGMDTRMIGLTASVTEIDPAKGDGIGVVSKYSELYQQYQNGYINNGDYFQNNRIPKDVYTSKEGYTVTFFDGEELNSITGLNTGDKTLFAGFNYIMFTASFANGVDNKFNDPKLQSGDVITVKQSLSNRFTLTIIGDNMVSETAGSSTKFTFANGSILNTSGVTTYIYKVVQEVSYEKVFGVKDLLDSRVAAGYNYLNMFLETKTETDTSGNVYVVDNGLSVRFKTNYSLQIPSAPLRTQITGIDGLEPLNKFYVTSQSSNYKQSLEIENLPIGTTDPELVDEGGNWANPNKVLVDNIRYSELRVGDYLLSGAPTSTQRALTRIIDKRIYKGNDKLALITCSDPIRRIAFKSSVNSKADLQTYLYKSVDNYTYAYNALVFNGFKLRPASLPDGTETTQNNILNIVGKGTSLFRALTNKEAIDYRYLVDSFGLGLREKSKQQLADICGSRKDIFGFLNMPSVRSFKQSSSPSFIDANGDLVVEFIAKGSNPDKAASFTYTFADGDGSTCVGYFTPYIQVDDNGRPLMMPPSAHVATTYMRKHTSNLGGITPWTIAAGVTNGRITNIVGLEHNYTNEDIEFLNGAQMNPIVFKRNRGNVIETENTAQTLYNSALSYIHVREVLIELERELSRMLLDFQWQYNTPEIRAEIKLRADVICETYVNRNGLYNYFNKMDDENNTSEIIDNQIGVLDTYVEPIRGMGIIVNNVTILRTGAIDAGGFM